MAEIITYILGTPAGNTRLLGTQMGVPQAGGPDRNLTRNFTVSSIAPLINTINLGYTSYVALLTQAGAVNPPVATVLQNTTGGTIVWTRTNPGEYTVTASSAIFTAAKTMVFINNGSSSATANIEWSNPTTTTITIDSTADTVLTAASFEIRIYS
tara:strand:- start:321 stop:785 length:465 start_codon:yes stop_codon:yes gene_type:complete